MMASILACVVSFVTALVVGAACLVLFFISARGDFSQLTGEYQPPFIYAGLPCVALFALSIAFAYWKLSAARVFAVVSVVVFFWPIVAAVAGYDSSPRSELIGFLLMAALSLLANWRIASLVRQQLAQTNSSALLPAKNRF
jgi:hypothetical protein